MPRCSLSPIHLLVLLPSTGFHNAIFLSFFLSFIIMLSPLPTLSLWTICTTAAWFNNGPGEFPGDLKRGGH